MPRVHETVFLAQNCAIIGDVEIAKDANIWFNAVIRGDINYIRIGERTNIQDGAILHVTGSTHPLIIGSDVTVGHGAILHGCTIENGCLIGMGAIVLDGAVVSKNSLVAAGALVLEGFIVPEGTLVAGVPAKVKRELTNEEKEIIMQSAQEYLHNVKSFRT